MRHADFPFVCSNYTFGDKSLKDQVLDYTIFNKDGLKVGVFGLGIELNGLVPDSLYGATQYMDPLKSANRIADYLKNSKDCDLVVCLSHLGYKYRSDRISDVQIAQNSRHIDLILGGHTHTFMKEAASYSNLDGKSVLVNQVGWAGILLGRIDIYLEKSSGWKWRKGRSHEIV
jgi:5'-nucleotidase